MPAGTVQQLTTWLNINARTNGFGQVGDTLTQMGELIGVFSDKIINFGKSSLDTYMGFETSMTQARIALATTYGKSGRDIDNIMSGLEDKAKDWAEATKFHIKDVGNAINLAAHAGWDYEKIMEGIPAAINLAYAGNIDLSEALDMVIKTANATGIEFKDLGTFIDAWAYAANSSATDIDEMGEAMEKMGATMRWAANPEEILTMLSVLANFGTTGSQAGTMLRSSMLRLVAPTKNASDAFALLEANAEELDEIAGVEGLAEAYQALTDAGFNGAYDNETGRLRPILDIYSELAVVLGNMAGGIENITTNEQTNSILSKIFPLRSIQAATALITAAASGYDGLYESMMGGEAAGYAEWGALMMMQTLADQIEKTKSKAETLEERVGEALSEKVEGVLDWVNGVLDSLNGMDEDKFNALVEGLTAIALTGTGLTLAGSAMAILGKILTPGGAIAVGLAAVAAAAAALTDLADSGIEDEFGLMNLNTDGIREYIHGIGSEFEYAYNQATEFKQSVNDAVTSYKETSENLSGELLEALLTHTTLTQDQKDQLQSLGNQMYTEVQRAITNANAASVSYWTWLFGGDGEAEYDPAYQEILDLTNQAYLDALAEAESIGQGLRDALTKAFEDGQIDSDEYKNILSYMRSYNDAIAKAASEADAEQRYIEVQKTLSRAQTASISDYVALSDEIVTQRDEALKKREEEFWNNYYKLEYRGADESTLATAKAAFENEQEKLKKQYTDYQLELFDVYLKAYGLEYIDEYYATKAADFLAGRITGLDVTNMEVVRGVNGTDDLERDTRTYIALVEKLGEVMSGIDVTDNYTYGSIGREDFVTGWRPQIVGMYYHGNYDEAVRQSLLMARMYIPSLMGYGGDTNYLINDYLPRQQERLGNRQYGYGELDFADLAALYQEYSVNSATTEQARQFIGTMEDSFRAGLLKVMSGEAKALEDAFTDQESLEMFWRVYRRLGNTYDMTLAGATLSSMGMQTNMAGVIYQLLYGVLSGISENFNFSNAGTTFSVGKDGQIDILATIDPNDEELVAVIENAQGTPIAVELVADLETLKQQLYNFRNQYGALNVTVRGKPTYAEGGRADTASIFGEAGPEWAIPEEHSERTAALLNEARAASGFTWPDILARFGGLNADANHRASTLIYSPTINAADASGVENALREDKRRLEKWYEERQMRERMEVFA